MKDQYDFSGGVRGKYAGKVSHEVNIDQRIAELYEEEIKNPLAIYYLSFADDDRGGFLGAVIVEAYGPITAVTRSKQLGVNPGGEVLIVKCPGPMLPELMNHLLSKQELEAAFGELQRMNSAGVPEVE